MAAHIETGTMASPQHGAVKKSMRVKRKAADWSNHFLKKILEAA